MAKCAMCAAEATHECPHSLGNWGCYAPLCEAHRGLHHPNDNAYQAWLKTDQGRELERKAGGLGGSIGPGSTGLWYAFMAGYSAASNPNVVDSWKRWSRPQPDNSRGDV